MSRIGCDSGAKKSAMGKKLSLPVSRAVSYRATMGFPEDLSRHAEQIIAHTPHIRGEEATKHALVVPFIQLLGYDGFDPREVQPEYTADFATKTRGPSSKPRRESPRGRLRQQTSP